MRTSPPFLPSTIRARRGFTLVEVVVVLVLLGLMAGLTAVSLRPPQAPARGEVGRVIATARSTALRRAQALDLRIEMNGAWSLRPDQGGDDPALASGRVRPVSSALHLRIDALGTCVPRMPVAWDATRCLELASR